MHWTAQTWRFLPSDFNYRTHHIQRYGEKKLPQGSTIQDWPISYQDLEPYYSAFEYDIGMGGKAGNLNGRTLPGGNPFEGPRSRPYPLPPLEMTIPADMFASACQRLGYHPFPQPTGILSRAFTDPFGNTRAACIYCGFCTRYGCEVDAKTSAQTTWLPVALRTGRYEIRTNSKVTGVNVGPDGLATGITYVDPQGQEQFQPADIVVLSGYTLTNVRMLLLSRSRQHPNGIGNDRGQVGRNYTYQLIKGPATGVFEGRRFNLYMGNSCVQQVIYDFNADNFDHADLDFIGGSSIFAGGGQRDPLTSTLSMPMLRQNGAGPGGGGDQSGQSGGNSSQGSNPARGGGDDNGNPHPATTGEVGSLQGSGQEWGQDWKENLRRNWDSIVGIAIQGESLPYTDQFLDLDPNYRDAWGLPLLRITYDFHENDYKLYRFIAARCAEIMKAMNPTRMDTTPELSPYNIHSYQSTHNTGGAIMGSDPSSSVTNKYGQVWDTPNVFVTGAALYPQNPGANPTETVGALVYMAGDAIRSQYLKNPGRVMT